MTLAVRAVRLCGDGRARAARAPVRASATERARVGISPHNRTAQSWRGLNAALNDAQVANAALMRGD